MNLRIQTGHAHSCPTLDAFSISLDLPPPLPTVYRRFQSLPASSCQAGTAFPTPYRVTSWIGVCRSSTCGSKCKNEVNLWISPVVVHNSEFQALRACFLRFAMLCAAFLWACSMVQVSLSYCLNNYLQGFEAPAVRQTLAIRSQRHVPCPSGHLLM
jgi:hypothetical protein